MSLHFFGPTFWYISRKVHFTPNHYTMNIFRFWYLFIVLFIMVQFMYSEIMNHLLSVLLDEFSDAYVCVMQTLAKTE